MKSILRLLLPIAVVALLYVFPSCQNPSEPTLPQNNSIVTSLKKVTVAEDFEAGSKTSYATGDVTFSSGVWTLNDALVGTSSSDPKNGTKSIRTRNSGIVTMQFNRTDGAGVVSVKHAKYGSDGNSTWQLWYSTNSGSSWTQTGSTVTTSSTTLATASFTVNVAGTIRFEIRKTDASANRVNFDDFTINDYSVAPPSSAFENFETGSKTSYTTADVTLGSGVWTFNNSVLGTSSSDRKVGTKSARIRSTGKLTMKFNKTSGAGIVTVQHAKYGSDANSSWQLWYSTNSGSSWSQTGSTITTTSTSLTTASFTVNVSGNIRFEIRKTTGSTSVRLNFDEVNISDYSGGGGGGGGGEDTTTSTSEHTVLGNPSNASANVSQYTNYLMEKPQYVLAYNRDKSEANWVAWHLSSSWLGSAARQDDFRADATLPSGWYQVGGSSYSGSGYDRGHMCPSADRTSSVSDNSATFLMTNMVPQAANNNQGPWASMENYLRTLVSSGNELYIYSGGYGSNGTIDNGHVTIPSYTWKIAVVLPEGSNDVSRVTTSTRVIAVVMPNDDAQISRSADWKTFRVSVDAIETSTGFNFLGKVDTAIQAVIEAQVDNQ